MISGTYSPVVGSVAYACPWAHYEGSTSCESFCLAGTYAATILDCLSCPGGSYADENATSCTTCAFANEDYEGAASCNSLALTYDGECSFCESEVFGAAVNGTTVYFALYDGYIGAFDTTTDTYSIYYSHSIEYGEEYGTNLRDGAVHGDTVYAFSEGTSSILKIQNGSMVASLGGPCEADEFHYGQMAVDAYGYIYLPDLITYESNTGYYIEKIVVRGSSYYSFIYCYTDDMVRALTVDLTTSVLYFTTDYGIYHVNVTAANGVDDFSEEESEAELLLDINVYELFGTVFDIAVAPEGALILAAANGTYYVNSAGNYSLITTALITGVAVGSDNVVYAVGGGVVGQILGKDRLRTLWFVTQ
jgi:hypothetical protein